MRGVKGERRSFINITKGTPWPLPRYINGQELFRTGIECWRIRHVRVNSIGVAALTFQRACFLCVGALWAPRWDTIYVGVMKQ